MAPAAVSLNQGVRFCNLNDRMLHVQTASTSVALPATAYKSLVCTPSRTFMRPIAAQTRDTSSEGAVTDIEDHLSDHHTVGDWMSKSTLITARIDTTVDEALELLVKNRITGMPVVDSEGKLVGVVSDYDLLALDSISGPRPTSDSESGIFPRANSTWKAFKEIQKLLIKTRGRTVLDVMTASPLCVRPQTNLEDAAKLLLDSKFRRLPVVNESGLLVGVLTRGNVVRAALELKKEAERAHAAAGN